MSKIPLQKKTLNLRAGDWSFLEERCRVKGLQVSLLIRYLVSRHVDSLKIGELDLDNLMEEISA